MCRLLSVRSYPVIFRTKTDKTEFPVDIRIRKAADLGNLRARSFELKPKYTEQRQEFAYALERIWYEGGWTPDFDELFYMDDELKLGRPIRRLLTQGSGKNITCVNTLQRPTASVGSNMVRFALGESTHVLCFGVDATDAAGLGKSTRKEVGDIAANLAEYHFVWYKRPNTIWTGTLNLKTNQLEGEFIR